MNLAAHRGCCMVSAAIALSLIGGVSPAQVSAPVSVTFKVTDATGAPVPYAEFEMIPSPAATPWPGTMEADGSGRLTLDLKKGAYCVAVFSEGFLRLEEHFDVSGPLTVPLKLTVGGCTECVTVQGASTASADTLLLQTTPFRGRPPIKLHADDLKAIPHITVTVHNPHTKADETYYGVPLIELLDKIGVPHGQLLRGNWMSEYIVATGSDGYKAVLALPEIDPEFHPGEVIVADAINGKPLDAKTGPFRLVVTEDQRPARSVRNLISVEVRQAR